MKTIKIVSIPRREDLMIYGNIEKRELLMRWIRINKYKETKLNNNKKQNYVH